MEKEIENIVKDALKTREDLFLVDVKVSGSGGIQKILILLDGDKGIGIEDCSKVSKHVAATLDEKDLVKEKYILEVSSPGADKPLKTIRQYNKNIGRKLKLTLTDGIEVKGELIEVRESTLAINKESKIKKTTVTELTEIPFNKIEKAKVLISF